MNPAWRPKTLAAAMVVVRFRIFDIWDHLHQWNGKKDHLWQILSKNTTWEWRHPCPGDTWHVPPGPMPALPCRRSQTRHVAVATSPLPAVWPGGPCRLPQFRQGDVAACRHPRCRHPLAFAAPTADRHPAESRRRFPHGTDSHANWGVF
jgi:hypothetical protein